MRSKKILCVALCILVVCLLTGCGQKAHPYPDDPLLSKFPPDITLGEAFDLYPDIMAHFPVRRISEEEAEVIRAEDERIITLDGIDDAEKILAVPFLAALNWRGGGIDGDP